MAGLQDIAPIVEKRCVTRAVRAPMRAAAAAASQPACPPPMTITSKEFIGVGCTGSVCLEQEKRACDVPDTCRLFHVKQRLPISCGPHGEEAAKPPSRT